MAPASLDVSEHELLFKATDLSKLADIDLSQYLEAYIVHIRNLYDNSIGVKDMNFAEAAMVIQNSSIIFAKNVDYIWTRAVNIRLALSANMNKKQSKDGDDDDESEEGVNDESGDKREKTARRKKKRIFNAEEFKLLDFIHTDKNIDLKLEKKENRQTKKLDKIVLPTNLRIKSKVNVARDIYTPEGEPVGKMDEFRLFWPITKSGFLQEDYESDDKCTFAATIYEQSFTENPTPADNVNNTILDDYNPLSPPPPTPPPTPPPMDLPLNDSPGSEDEIIAGKEKENAERIKRGPRECTVSLDKVVERAWDPMPLEGGIPEKPLLKRKVYKLEVLNHMKKRKHGDKGVSETETFIVSEFFTMGKYSVKAGPGFDAWFLAEYHSEQLKRQKEAHLRRKKILDMLDTASEFEGDFYGFDDTEINGGFDSDNDCNDADDVGNIDVPLPTNTTNMGTIFDNFATGSIWNKNADDAVDRGNEYEAHALRTIQQYKANKSLDESRANDLAMRVSAWHDMIGPVLKEAEKRSQFDIHEYGTRILNHFPNNNCKTTISFEKIARNNSPEEVTRYFLSSLVLANTYNIHLSKSLDGELVTNCMELTLLSKVRHQDEIDDNMRGKNKS